MPHYLCLDRVSRVCKSQPGSPMLSLRPSAPAPLSLDLTTGPHPRGRWFLCQISCSILSKPFAQVQDCVPEHRGRPAHSCENGLSDFLCTLAPSISVTGGTGSNSCFLWHMLSRGQLVGTEDAWWPNFLQPRKTIYQNNLTFTERWNRLRSTLVN